MVWYTSIYIVRLSQSYVTANLTEQQTESNVLVESFHRLAAQLLWSGAMYLGNNHLIGNLVIGVVHIQSTVLHAGVTEQYDELHCCRLVDFLFATTADVK